MCRERTHPESDRVLEVRAANKRFGSLAVLEQVSFAVRPGQAVGIVGPNGSGKSTLLRCTVGAETLDSGEVLLDGGRLDESDPGTRAALACLLDDADYFPDLSVLEHLRLYAWAHADPHPESTVDRVLEEVGLSSASDQLPVTLSTGQRHRLGLASCLVRPRRALVLDEPEQRLDASGRRWLARRLAQEKELGHAVIFASHDATLLDALADDLVQIGR